MMEVSPNGSGTTAKYKICRFEAHLCVVSVIWCSVISAGRGRAQRIAAGERFCILMICEGPL